MSPRSPQHEVPTAWNAVTERVIACAIEVHTVLGPGLLESIYEAALMRELSLKGLRASRQAPYKGEYKGVDLPELRLDVVVEELIALELKSVETVHDAHLAQLVSQLRFAGLPLGLLINFNVTRLVLGVHRRLNPAAIEARLSNPDSPPLRSLRSSGTSAFPPLDFPASPPC